MRSLLLRRARLTGPLLAAPAGVPAPRRPGSPQRRWAAPLAAAALLGAAFTACTVALHRPAASTPVQGPSAPWRLAPPHRQVVVPFVVPLPQPSLSATVDDRAKRARLERRRLALREAARKARRAAAPPPLAARPLGTRPLDSSRAVALRRLSVGGAALVIVSGGRPVSREVQTRQSVPDFVRQSGAAAGINGTFFVDAALRSLDGRMIGPVYNRDVPFRPDHDARRLQKLAGRPLVVWDRQTLAFVPFSSELNSLAALQRWLPQVTDAFVAGAWLVRGGHALSAREIAQSATGDAAELRPRVFFGVTAAGVPIIGASTTPTSSAQLARAALAAGAQDAALLDSGYSTSLVYAGQLLAVGSRTKAQPSRLVPHAIVLMAPDSAAGAP